MAVVVSDAFVVAVVVSGGVVGVSGMGGVWAGVIGWETFGVVLGSLWKTAGGGRGWPLNPAALQL